MQEACRQEMPGEGSTGISASTSASAASRLLSAVSITSCASGHGSELTPWIAAHRIGSRPSCSTWRASRLRVPKSLIHHADMISSRHYIFALDGSLRRMSSRIAFGVYQGNDALPEFAGSRPRTVRPRPESNRGNPAHLEGLS